MMDGNTDSNNATHLGPHPPWNTNLSSPNYFFGNNNSDSIFNGVDGKYKYVKQPMFMVVIFIVAYSIIFMAALIGNTMVVAVVILRPGMRNVTNLFIANLAVADMLVAVFCIPITLMDNLYYGWPFGEVLCKLSPYMQGVSVCASVYILAAIAVDRYLAICFKPQCRLMRRGACLILGGIWVFSFTLVTPWLVYYKHFPGNNYSHVEVCSPKFPTFQIHKLYYLFAILLGTYILPLLVVFMCYILIARRVWQRRAPGVTIGCNIIRRCRIKVIKMLVTVVSVFALSWLPLHILYILILFISPRDQQVNTQITNIGVPFAQWLELSNSGINAILYCIFSENFRRGFLDLFRCVLRRRRCNYKRGTYMIPPRRVRRSMSEESTMMGSCVVQRSQASSKFKDTRTFLQMCALEKRHLWRNGFHSNNDMSTSVSTDSKTGNSIVQKSPRITGLSCSSSLNNGFIFAEINKRNSNDTGVRVC